ncbi:hypothetical protein [Hymenobacter cellulosivorans]|uniref:Uncharacterized protein n=1 Tax=Hymenobacter cellulosivorans TaxID=2932249 RepID=A0ABY4F7M9_9BACT|nr:hypothetical protein [Hymenobacter cellulosivorans]UOQ52007.1 hypothetical protein MUN80_19865 [Hymenobacter cellulosivorans]
MKLLLLPLVLLTLLADPPSGRPAPKSAPAAGVATSFRRFNLAPLWVLYPREAEAQTMLGCMGPQYRPFNLVFEKVQRDAKKPALYHVRGKSREQERILPFSGTITLTSLKKVRIPDYANNDQFKSLGHYQANGRFRFVESATEEGAGTFTGQLTITFSRTASGLAYMPRLASWWDEGSASEGSKFTSTWTSPAHPAAVKLVWASNFMEIAGSVMERFNVGDRGRTSTASTGRWVGKASGKMRNGGSKTRSQFCKPESSILPAQLLFILLLRLMRTSLVISFLAMLASSGCQQQTASTATEVAPVAPEVTAASSAATTAAPLAPVASASSLTKLLPEKRAFLQQNNIAPLWQNDTEERRQYPAFSGFYGADHYRISFVFTRVTQDQQRPELFHVQGKSQFKKAVTPFAGTLTVSQIAELDTFLDLDSASSATAKAYTVTAGFELRENSAAKGAGVFRGTGYLDLYRTADGKLHQCSSMPSSADKDPTRGSGLLFSGEWVSNTTGQHKPLLLANDPFVIAPDVLKDFGIGERSGEINPKYAKLGWTEVWENEEWWADKPVSSL